MPRPLTHDEVVRAATDWVWYPPEAGVVATDRYLLVLFPDHFGDRLQVVRTGAPADAALVPEVLERARRMEGADDLRHLTWWVRLDAPRGLEVLLQARGQREETLSVLARPCDVDLPDLSVPPDVEVRPVVDSASARDAFGVEAAVFGGRVPGPAVLAATAETGRSGRDDVDKRVVAYLDGEPVGIGGITVVDGVARLWGGAVMPHARGRGVYRALLDARLRRAAALGARTGLVKGRVETSAPVLRRAGFTAYGEERSYRLSW